jgi:DNA-directed RNA polymerase specialized sigma24 family protein
LESIVLRSPSEVVRALLTYTDWWQPSTSSVMQVGGARRVGRGFADGLPSGLLATIDVRTELCRRMARLEDRDRSVLFLWYVRQLAVGDIARAVGVSRRHCFRLRSAAIRKLVELGEPEKAA